jgi:heparosan-N-sulfate-glucuronate 5-epimerase
MSVDLLFNVNTTLTVTVQNRETQKLYYIHYIVADMMISVQDENIYYGMGVNGKTPAWRHLTRDLYIDLHKGLPRKKRKMRRMEVKVLEIAFYGAGSFDNLTLATTEHMSCFYDAAEWFIRHQDPTSGGWAIPVKRKLGSGFNELPRGWYV